MRTPPLLADFIHHRVCKPICEKLLTLPGRRGGLLLFSYDLGLWHGSLRKLHAHGMFNNTITHGYRVIKLLESFYEQILKPHMQTGM